MQIFAEMFGEEKVEAGFVAVQIYEGYFGAVATLEVLEDRRLRVGGTVIAH